MNFDFEMSRADCYDKFEMTNYCGKFIHPPRYSVNAFSRLRMLSKSAKMATCLLKIECFGTKKYVLVPKITKINRRGVRFGILGHAFSPHKSTDLANL